MLANEEGRDPWGQESNLTPAQQREQRQRSIRFLMMFLLMLTLMDGEEAQRRRDHEVVSLRKGKNSKYLRLEESVYSSRRNQDKNLEFALESHPRYKRLVAKNEGRNFEKEIRIWAEQQSNLQTIEFPININAKTTEPNTPEEEKIFHYPWNATGFYRGTWARALNEVKNKSLALSTPERKDTLNEQKTSSETSQKAVTPKEIEGDMMNLVREQGGGATVLLLPDGIEFDMSNSSASSVSENFKRVRSQQSSFLRRGTLNSDLDTLKDSEIPLTKASGRAAFQLYSRSVPAIKELGIVDGFIKLYDSNTVGYSTRRDVLLRVSGVLIHSIGVMSLVSSSSPGRSALVIRNPDEKVELHRKLEGLVSKTEVPLPIGQIRRHVADLYTSENFPISRPTKLEYDTMFTSPELDTTKSNMQRSLARSNQEGGIKGAYGEDDECCISDFVFPYPFVRDDAEESIARARTPAARSMPPREQQLEANAGSCEFEILLNIQEEPWTVTEWRSLLTRYERDARKVDPSSTSGNLGSDPKGGDNENRNKKNARKSHSNKILLQDQALAMMINGTIVSKNCNFHAELNAAAVRTDWENTTGKAINYSFYMMLTCLTQIVLLLRQLLHTQAQSAASRVSLLCIGWQTVLDALLCLTHIYLSLAMQPLFTAFASVAFFKLLIFCVIEMKYMAIIIQARNANNGGNTVELLRRQIAMLHLRFYVALMGSFLACFYAWDSYRTLYMFLLYSFWVPQILQNVVTEAKRPLHHYYIYGMSLTRLVAPLYVFAVQNNFLKEVYPDSPTDFLASEILVLWVGIQAAVLEAQGRYGARFMIPARFLPPKFDYNRPIPASLLPPTIEGETPSQILHNERASPSEVQAPLLPRDTSSHRPKGARNRMKGKKTNRNEGAMTTETITATQARPCPSFDCVICYNEIDIRNSAGYMLAPCDHLFHKECLVQWMEVKMECPICRKVLPTL